MFDLETKYKLWLEVRKYVAIVLMILIFAGVRQLLIALDVDHAIVTAASLSIVLISAAIGWLATGPLERKLFGDQIEEGSLRPWLKVTITVLLLVGAALVGFDAWNSYQHAGGGRETQSNAEQNAAAERARNAQLGRETADAIRQIEDLRRARAATRPTTQATTRPATRPMTRPTTRPSPGAAPSR